MNNTIGTAHIKALFIIAFATLSYTQIYSQKKTFEGYYISKTGDSVRGTFPNYTQWTKNPETVKFFPSVTSGAINLTPQNTFKFSIENYDTYFSYTGQRLINPIDFNEVITQKDTFGFADQYAPISAFVRIIAQTGNLQVFALTDNIRTNYFYRLNSDTLTELKFKMYYDQNNVNEVNEYRQQLYSLFKDEIEKRNLAVNLERVVYTEESISDLINMLTPVKKRRTKVKSAAAGIVVSVGASINFLKVTGDKTIDVTNLLYKTSFSPLLSVGYWSPFARGFGRVFVYPQLKFYNFKNEGQVADGVQKRVTTFKSGLVASPVINVGVNIINANKHTFFAMAGGGVIFLLNNKEENKRIVVSSNSVLQSNQFKMSGLSYAANLSAGATFSNKWIASVTYNIPVPIANFYYYTPYHSSLQTTLGYKF